MGEFTIRADKDQTTNFIEWATGVDGDGRLWAVEAATGLGLLLSQQLVASGEPVVDVPPVLASRIRVLSSGKSNKNDEIDARSVAIAVLRRDGLAEVRREDEAAVLRILAKRARRTHLPAHPGGLSPPCDPCRLEAWRYGTPLVGETGVPHARRDLWPRHGR